LVDLMCFFSVTGIGRCDILIDTQLQVSQRLLRDNLQIELESIGKIPPVNKVNDHH